MKSSGRAVSWYSMRGVGAKDRKGWQRRERTGGKCSRSVRGALGGSWFGMAIAVGLAFQVGKGRIKR